MMGSYGCASRFSPHPFFLRCGSAKSVAEGKISRFKVLSCHQRAFRIGKLQPLHRYLPETQMVRRRWIPVQIGSHEAAALRPWVLVPESLVALAAEVRLTYIGVSKTNEKICVNLQFLYRRPNQYKRKLSEWDIKI
ncbi:Hypothetical_protein [Hexamita inflata]|uniref:Hypothetical_protein n=1 Tax=Hexamita inflata TaxID=28002 RepID=A0AA86Q831_9EUKA|nr:Hypothetical protein HINF_LOCUS38817 [Hexamita inflata]